MLFRIIFLILTAATKTIFAACPDDSVRVVVYNSSYNIISLKVMEKGTCKLYDVAKVRPGIKGKYCVKYDYMIMAATQSLKGETTLAMTATDLRNDLIITTPRASLPDVTVQRIKRVQNTKLLGKEESIITSKDSQDDLINTQRQQDSSVDNTSTSILEPKDSTRNKKSNDDNRESLIKEFKSLLN